jgi:hypothetical protein
LCLNASPAGCPAPIRFVLLITSGGDSAYPPNPASSRHRLSQQRAGADGRGDGNISFVQPFTTLVAAALMAP